MEDGIQVKSWAEMSADDFFEIARLRSEVFFLEQSIDAPDFDALDRHPATFHWWIPDGHGCAAYLRTVVLDDPELGARRSFGRLVVRADRRREGLARSLVIAVLDWCGVERMVIHAQTHVAAMYEELGFQRRGPEYREAGLPHVIMVRPGQER